MDNETQLQLQDFARLFTIPRESARQIVKLIFENLFNIETFDMDNIPAEGGGIIISNHTDYMDVLIQGTYSPRKIIYLGKNELFEPDKEIMKFIYQEGSPLNSPLFVALRPILDQAIKTYAYAQKNQFLEWGGHPVIRNYRGNSAKAAVQYYQDLEDYMVRLLKEGNFLSIYPEGTRADHDSTELMPFKALAAKIAIRANVPIIPSAIVGAHGFTSILNYLTGSVFTKNIRFKTGKLITPEQFPKDDIKKSSKELTKRLQSEVQKLIDELKA